MERSSAEQTEMQKKGICACFKKGWQAIKHTCSRNNDVVPFHPPSDPQPGPSIQTGLQVFNTTVLQDPADLLPCNSEETPLDSSDLKYDPSGLEASAPERPSDHQPGKKKKKVICACGWRAIKHTYSRSQNNKVVAFHLPSASDLDPSDPQPGPFSQTCLRVFKPVVLQETADCLPGSCWEQTPLTDPADTQSGPSSLESSAPQDQADTHTGSSVLEETSFQEPADSQPGSSYLNQTAFQDPGDHQPGSPGLEPSASQDPGDTKSNSSKLEPSDPEEPTDSQPSSCNWEQMSLKGPTDHRPGLSGLEPSAPQEEEELADSRSFSMLYEVSTKNLGRGLCGIVYEGIRRSDGQKVAIKIIAKKVYDYYINIPGYSKPLFSEVALNLLLQKPEKCPHIVEILDWFNEETQHILIMEYPQPCKSLYDFVVHRGYRLSEMQARGFMRQAVISSKHCIDHNVLYRDMKLDNILINTETMELKFIDFGGSQLALTSGIPGTENYGRPNAVKEMVRGLGNLLCAMVRGSPTMALCTVGDIKYLSAGGLSEECFDLLHQCIFTKPSNRPTLDELLDHKWFKER